MLRVVARFRMLTALLLLLAGQLGMVASAQATTCLRTEARKEASSVVKAPAADPARNAPVETALALPDDGHRHDAPAPVGDPVPTSSCSPAAALPQRRAEALLLSTRLLPVSAWAESPPRDLLFSGFFRPPRPS